MYKRNVKVLVKLEKSFLMETLKEWLSNLKNRNKLRKHIIPFTINLLMIER